MTTPADMAPRLVSARGAWLLERAPIWLRTWPLIRRYYWQDWQIKAAWDRAEALKRELDW